MRRQKNEIAFGVVRVIILNDILNCYEQIDMYDSCKW